MVFLTGGTGLLGSHLLIELLKRGKSVRALKRKTSSLVNVKNTFSFYLGEKSNDLFESIDWVDGDINEITSLQNLMIGCDEVYHCAGYVSFYRKDFKKLMKINKDGTANLVNVSLEVGVKKFSYVSSTAAIGRDKKGKEYTENSKWLASPEISNYAVSKHAGEMEVWRGQEEGLNTSIVNPSVILGAGDWQEGSLTLFSTVKKGLKFYTKGVNAFVDVRDVAFCMVELLEQNIFSHRFLIIAENVCFKDLFFHIADELNTKRPSIKVTSFLANVAWRVELVKSLIFGVKPKITKETSRSAMSMSRYSNEKISTQLNYKFISIHESVKNAVAFNTFISSKEN
jgi:dihydroflavonol-4-reductase